MTLFFVEFQKNNTIYAKQTVGLRETKTTLHIYVF